MEQSLLFTCSIEAIRIDESVVVELGQTQQRRAGGELTCCCCSGSSSDIRLVACCLPHAVAVLWCASWCMATPPAPLDATEARRLAQQKLDEALDTPWTDRELAIGLCSEAIALDPTLPYVRYVRAKCLEQLGRRVEAVNDLTHELRLGPPKVDLLCDRGWMLLDLERAHEALVDFRRAVLLDPWCANLYLGTGSSLRVLGRVSESIEQFDTAIRVDPSLAHAYNGRGVAHQYNATRAEALRDFDEAIRLYPEFHFAYSNRGSLLEESSRHHEAIKDFDEALRLEPSFVDALSYRGMAHRCLGNYDKALLDFGEAIRLDPKACFAYNNRGVVYQRLARFDEAMQDYTEAIRLSHDYANAYANRALLRIERSRDRHDPQAMQDLEQALVFVSANLVKYPRDPMLYWVRGRTLRVLGRFDEAVLDFDRSAALNPDDSQVYLERGLLYFEQALYDHARRNFLKALSIDFASMFLLSHSFNHKRIRARTITNRFEFLHVYAYAYLRVVSVEIDRQTKLLCSICNGTIDYNAIKYL